MSFAGPVSRLVEVTADVHLHALLWTPHEKTRKPPFLLVHGLASNAQLWLGLGRILADAGHRVVAVDQRGHGLSAKVDDGYDFPTLTDDLVAVMRAMDLDTPVVVGQSWGGNVVLELAARHGQQLSGVACLDGGQIDLSEQFDDLQAMLDALRPPPLAGMRAADVEDRLRQMAGHWPDEGVQGQLGNFLRLPDGTIRPHLTLDRHLTILRHMWDHHPRQRYEDVQVPVLLLPVRGGYGGSEKARAVKDAMALLPRARLHWLEGHHDAHAEQPHVVAGILLDAVHDGFFGSPADPSDR